MGHVVILCRVAECACAWTGDAHVGLVDATLPALRPPRTHHVVIRAVGISDAALVAGLGAEPVHEAAVPHALSVAGPAGTPRVGVTASFRLGEAGRNENQTQKHCCGVMGGHFCAKNPKYFRILRQRIFGPFERHFPRRELTST